MGIYAIKQRINTTCLPPAAYDMDKKYKNSCICIAQKAGKFGILKSDGALFLPFEYDNISMAAANLYILIKDGKMGLLHTKRSCLGNDRPFEIVKLIPCEYDLITVNEQTKNFVCMRKDTETGSNIRIYFSKYQKISEPYLMVLYIDNNYIIVTDIDTYTEKIFYKNGELVYSIFGKEDDLDYKPYSLSVYYTNYGNVFVLNDLEDSDSVKFVVVEKDLDEYGRSKIYSVKEYSFDCFIRPIWSILNMRSPCMKFASGFIVKHNGYYQLIDAKCRCQKSSNFRTLTFCVSLEGTDENDVPIEMVFEKEDIYNIGPLYL